MEHVWNGCKCGKCDKTREHDWSKDCEKCANCGKARENEHKWQEGKCRLCGKSIDEQDAKGYTRLAMAAFNNSRELVENLLKGGANIRAKNKDDMGALMWAAQKGYLEIVKILIAAGADVRAKTNVHNTALTLATINGYDEIVKLLVEAGSDVNAADVDGNVVLMAAVQKCDASTVKLLLEKGANLHVGQKAGKTILSNAILSGRADNVKMLMSHGAKLTWDAGTLVVMAGDGHLDMMKLLLEQGADVNAAEKVHHLTPLLAAAAYGNLHMVKLLLNKGADQSAKDKYGNTAIALAEMKRRTDTVTFLRSYKQENVTNTNLAKDHSMITTGNLFSIGGMGPGGGIVFYVDDTGLRGLEARPAAEARAMTWPAAVDFVATLVRTMGPGWRLPTIEELKILYQQRKFVGGFDHDFHWSSTEVNSDNALSLVDNNGIVYPLRKRGDACYVRAIRDFGPSDPNKL